MLFRGLVLAAGKGSRFVDQDAAPMPKVLHLVLGRPMVCWVLDALRLAGIEDITLVVGYLADEVISALGCSVRYAMQIHQRGSGDAVASAAGEFANFDGGVVVMCGDSPLFTADTLKAMMSAHTLSKAAVTLSVAELDDPSGYGRIQRDETGRISGVIEERCADDSQKAVREVNGGAYVFDAKWLFDNIGLMAINDAGEYNLTDMVRVAVRQQRFIAEVGCDPSEIAGVNTPEELRRAEELLRRRK
jgi:bifunctional UDP-N-acetylglucosamine pyrophosphorylase/glucosamine-1-phosphate N-acetyltransferase